MNKKHILTVKSRKDFVKIYREGELCYRPTVILQKNKTPEKYKNINNSQRAENFVRYGITVTKKITKIAVYRNKIRRQIREILKTLLDKYGEPYYDYVVVARKFSLNSDFGRLSKDLEECFKRTNSTNNSLENK